MMYINIKYNFYLVKIIGKIDKNTNACTKVVFHGACIVKNQALCSTVIINIKYFRS